MKYLFDPTDGANAAGFKLYSSPLGASDFSASRELIVLHTDCIAY